MTALDDAYAVKVKRNWLAAFDCWVRWPWWPKDARGHYLSASGTFFPVGHCVFCGTPMRKEYAAYLSGRCHMHPVEAKQ